MHGDTHTSRISLSHIHSRAVLYPLAIRKRERRPASKVSKARPQFHSCSSINKEKMQELQDPVVAALANQSAHPYSSLAMSSNRKYAIVAGKDTLQLMEVSPRGLSQIRTMRISQVRIKLVNGFCRGFISWFPENIMADSTTSRWH